MRYHTKVCVYFKSQFVVIFCCQVKSDNDICYSFAGQEKELSSFLHEVNGILKNENVAALRSVIVFEGEIGVGKTRMLEAAMLCCMERGLK